MMCEMYIQVMSHNEHSITIVVTMTYETLRLWEVRNNPIICSLYVSELQTGTLYFQGL